MIIEIRKAGFVNKGAELMLHAVIQKIKERYPDAKLVMTPTHANASRPYHKFAPLGFYPKASFRKKGIQWAGFLRIFPREFREMYGMVLDREIDVVLDAAGFSYSEQWGVSSSRELAYLSRKWRKNGTKLILLPQAFGPYSTTRIQRYVKEWVANADLIFAREEDSHRYVTQVVGEQEKIKIYPDFTNALDGILPDGYDPSDKKVALVPNYRMIDKTDPEESACYLPFMIECAKYLVAKEARPFLLVHEGEKDRLLAEEIAQAVGGIPIVTETDPLKIKGILGASDATIGSRFHGLVSALSQGIPSLATGWSHKYLRLFENYDFSEGVVSVLDSHKAIREKVDLIIDPNKSSCVKNRLREKSKYYKTLTEEMWKEVFSHLDQKNNEARVPR